MKELHWRNNIGEITLEDLHWRNYIRAEEFSSAKGLTNFAVLEKRKKKKNWSEKKKRVKEIGGQKGRREGR